MINLAALAGRVLLSAIFILSGFSKIISYAGTQQYMDGAGVPGFLLPLVVALELGGGLAVLVGWFTRPAAWALATFSILAAGLFHAEFGNELQQIMFMKNFAIAGGLLLLAAYGPGALSLDRR